MKRRHFISLVGASALGAPFLVKQLGGSRIVLPSADRSRRSLDLELTVDEQRVVDVLRAHSKGVYLLGGCVVGKLQGRALPYVNLMVESDDFIQIKRELFELGVDPVSTPELPGSIIRFGFRETPYSVVNLTLKEYLATSLSGEGGSVVPFAHNYLVYACHGKWVMDPFGAFAGKSIPRKNHRIQLLAKPESAVAGLTCALAATFDVALLGLKESAPCGRVTRRSLEQSVSGIESDLVMEQVVNYVPDVLEACGFDTMQRFLTAPLCVAAARESAGVDLQQVGAALDAARESGVPVDGIRFMGALNDVFLKKKELDGLGFGLSDYMASKGFMVRRVDLLMAAINRRKLESTTG